MQIVQGYELNPNAKNIKNPDSDKIVIHLVIPMQYVKCMKSLLESHVEKTLTRVTSSKIKRDTPMGIEHSRISCLLPNL